MSLLTEQHLAWIGREDPPVHVEVSRRDIVKYAIATGQQLQKYLGGDEAPPMFVFNLFGALRPLGELGEDGLALDPGGPPLPLPRRMAGGVELRLHRAIRPGDRLRGVSRVSEIHEREGRLGPMIVVVRELCVTDADGQPVCDEIRTSFAL